MRTRWYQLAFRLREFLKRIRAEAGTEPGEGSVPAVLSHARIATRLLLARCEQEGMSSFSNWLTSLDELLVYLESRPGLVTKSQPALSDFVSWQESLLTSLDAGIELADAVELQEVASLQERLTAAWRDPLPVSRDTSAISRVLLLVSCSLRASELKQRVQSAGFSIIVCTSPDEVVSLLEKNQEATAVLCDEVEPTRNLRQMSDVLQRVLPQSRPRLILATGSQHPEMALRARHLGAHGIWSVPFRAVDLRDLCS